MDNQHSYDGYNVQFFEHLDTPLMIFIFESDEFSIGMAVYLSTMIIAALMDIEIPGGVFVYAIVAVFSMIGYIKFKKSRPSGYTNGRLYRLGFLQPRTYGFKKLMTKKEKKFKVLPHGFLNDARGN